MYRELGLKAYACLLNKKVMAFLLKVSLDLIQIHAPGNTLI